MFSKKSKGTIDKSFLFKLTGRTSLFFALLLLVLVFFYLSGNYQNFLDTTQAFTLFMCSADCIVLFLFSLAGIIESIGLFFVSRKKRYWIFFGVFFISGIISAAVFMALRTVSILSLGI